MVIEGGIPLFGRIIVRVEGVVPVSIHGDVYFDLTVRILPHDDEDGLRESDCGDEEEVGGSGGKGEVIVGEWAIREPAYQVRLPNHLCEGRIPQRGDILEVMFIAQQASEVVYLS